jgi:hypothetical protein
MKALDFVQEFGLRFGSLYRNEEVDPVPEAFNLTTNLPLLSLIPNIPKDAFVPAYLGMF